MMVSFQSVTHPVTLHTTSSYNNRNSKSKSKWMWHLDLCHIQNSKFGYYVISKTRNLDTMSHPKLEIWMWHKRNYSQFNLVKSWRIRDESVITSFVARFDHVHPKTSENIEMERLVLCTFKNATYTMVNKHVITFYDLKDSGFNK